MDRWLDLSGIEHIQEGQPISSSQRTSYQCADACRCGFLPMSIRRIRTSSTKRHSSRHATRRERHCRQGSAMRGATSAQCQRLPVCMYRRIISFDNLAYHRRSGTVAADINRKRFCRQHRVGLRAHLRSSRPCKRWHMDQSSKYRDLNPNRHPPFLLQAVLNIGCIISLHSRKVEECILHSISRDLTELS